MVQRAVVSSSSPAWGAVLAVLCLICFLLKPRLHCVLRSCPRPSGSKGPTVAVVSSTLFSCAICRNLPVNPPKVTRERVRHKMVMLAAGDRLRMSSRLEMRDASWTTRTWYRQQSDESASNGLALCLLPHAEISSQAQQPCSAAPLRSSSCACIRGVFCAPFLHNLSPGDALHTPEWSIVPNKPSHLYIIPFSQRHT